MIWMDLFETPNSDLRIIWLFFIIGIGWISGDIRGRLYKKEYLNQEEQK